MEGAQLFALCYEVSQTTIALYGDRATQAKSNFVLWKNIFSTALITKQSDILDESHIMLLAKLAMRLFKTSPTIFGPECCVLNSESKEAEFRFNAFSGAVVGDEAVDNARAIERHDMVMWFAVYFVLGKGFHVDGWDTITGEVISDVQQLDPKEIVMNIKIGDQTIVAVSRATKQSVEAAIDASSNRPTNFFRSKHAAISAANILGVDWLEWTFPYPEAMIDSFDWSTVILADKDTYPPRYQPTDREFEIIRTVYKQIESEKHKEAVKLGMPKSGVQAYNTFKHRLRDWFYFTSVYRFGEPTLPLVSVEEKVRGQIKLCKSSTAIDEVIQVQVKFEINKAKRLASSNQLLRRQSEEADEALKQAAQEKAAAVAERERIQEERQAIENAEYLGTRQARNKAREDALVAKQAEIEAADKAQKEAAENERAKRQAQLALQEKAKRLKNNPGSDFECPGRFRKPARRDLSQLDETETPRSKAESLGVDWNPPSLLANAGNRIHYEAPGPEWARESIKKFRLLGRLRDLLTTEGVLFPPMTIHRLMEALDIDNVADVEFEGRVFLYLMALVLNEDW